MPVPTLVLVQQMTDRVLHRLASLPEVVPGLTADVQYKILISGLTILALVFLRRGVLRVVDRRVESPHARYRWSKTSSYVSFVLGVLVVVQVWFSALTSVGTFLGLLSAGLAIALKDLVADLAGWIFIMWRRPFDLGDRIQIGDHAGDVVDIRIFAFTIMEIGNWVGADQSTGPDDPRPQRPGVLPAPGQLHGGLSLPVERAPGAGHLRERLAQGQGDAGGDRRRGGGWTRARRPRRTLRQTSKRFLIHYTKLTPVVYTSVQDSGVLLTIRYLMPSPAASGHGPGDLGADPRRLRRADDIDFAYPTQRLYLNPIEGKPGARAPCRRCPRGRDAVRLPSRPPPGGPTPRRTTHEPLPRLRRHLGRSPAGRRGGHGAASSWSVARRRAGGRTGRPWRRAARPCGAGGPSQDLLGLPGDPGGSPSCTTPPTR